MHDRLQTEAVARPGRPGRQRRILLLVAASLVAALAAGTVLGTGFVKLPWLVVNVESVAPSPSVPGESAAPSSSGGVSPQASPSGTAAPSAPASAAPPGVGGELVYELVAGTFAEVVTTDLVYRTAPRIADDSIILGRFNAPTRVFVAKGPVEADGYRWFLVQIEGEYTMGWVAAAGKDGEEWLRSLGHEPGKWVIETTLPFDGGNLGEGDDGRIYFMGVLQSLPSTGEGLAGSGVANRAYDPTTGSWSELARRPEPRVDALVSRGGDGLVYVVGGRPWYGDYSGEETDTVAIYDPATDTWQDGPSMPAATTARWSYIGLVDGRLRVIYYDRALSALATDSHVLSTASYDIGTREWLPYSSAENGQCISDVAFPPSGDTVYVLTSTGGFCPRGGSVIVADGDARQEFPLRLRRFGGQLTILPDGRLIIWGGEVAHDPSREEPEVEQDYHQLTAVEVFDPATGELSTLPPRSLPPENVVVAGNDVFVIARADRERVLLRLDLTN